MDKKTSNDVAKVLLIIGIIIWVLSCCLAVVIDLSLDSWLFIFIGIAILSPMIASGYIYSKNIKNVHKKRYWIIRIVSLIFILDMIYLIVKKIFLTA